MDRAPNADHPVPTAPATAEQELQQALSFLGHDARAGHSSTLALLDLQRIQADPDSLPQLLGRIEANARRSLDAIDDFADLIRARRQVLQLDAVELTDLLVEVVADVWTAAHQSGVRILIAPGPASIVATADRALLAAALAKLLRDAVNAAASGTDISCSVAVEGRSGILEMAESTPVTAQASRKPPSSLLFARGVAQRHGGQALQSAAGGARRTRLVLPIDDVSKSISP